MMLFKDKALATKAIPIPVLPAVPSIIVPPGFTFLFLIASL